MVRLECDIPEMADQHRRWYREAAGVSRPVHMLVPGLRLLSQHEPRFHLRGLLLPSRPVDVLLAGCAKLDTEWTKNLHLL